VNQKANLYGVPKVHDITFPAKAVKFTSPSIQEPGSVRVTIADDQILDFLHAIMTDDLVEAFFCHSKTRQWLAERLIGYEMMEQTRLEMTPTLHFDI
jgi:hypothetical protein